LINRARQHLRQRRDHQRHHDRRGYQRHGHREDQRYERKLGRDGQAEGRVELDVCGQREQRHAQKRRPDVEAVWRSDRPQHPGRDHETSDHDDLGDAFIGRHRLPGALKTLGQLLLLHEVRGERHFRRGD
jgi:hypothetical protein